MTLYSPEYKVHPDLGCTPLRKYREPTLSDLGRQALYAARDAIAVARLGAAREFPVMPEELETMQVLVPHRADPRLQVTNPRLLAAVERSAGDPRAERLLLHAGAALVLALGVESVRRHPEARVKRLWSEAHMPVSADMNARMGNLLRAEDFPVLFDDRPVTNIGIRWRDETVWGSGVASGSELKISVAQASEDGMPHDLFVVRAAQPHGQNRSLEFSAVDVVRGFDQPRDLHQGLTMLHHLGSALLQATSQEVVS